MGRKLRRVPLDFDWPHDEVWKGFINPHSEKSISCPDCENGYAPEAARMMAEWYGNTPFDPVAYGARPLAPDHPIILARAEANFKNAPGFYLHHGESPEERRDRYAKRHAALSNEENPESIETYAKRGQSAAIEREAHRLYELWRNQWCHNLIQADVDALVAADRLWDFTRVPRNDEQRRIVDEKRAAGGNSWLPESSGYRPTAAEVNDWSINFGLGHDSFNAGICVRARCEREGHIVACPTCGGSATMWASPEEKAAWEAWEPEEPPAGEGYQLWETVSEGSPISPVFADEEGLVRFLIDEEECSEKAARAFVRDAWAPSGVAVVNADGSGEYLRNIESCAIGAADEKEG